MQLFRSFDENADGTVSQHEFRKGITNLGECGLKTKKNGDFLLKNGGFNAQNEGRVC